MIFYIQAVIIFYMQKYLPYNTKYLITTTKLFTKRLHHQFLILCYTIYYKDFKLLLLYHISMYINLVIKTKFRIMRPFVDYNFLKNPKNKNKANSYSFPSNSFQNSLLIYHYLLYPISPLLYYILILSIMISRMILALHYPHDFVMSYLLFKSIIMFIS